MKKGMKRSLLLLFLVVTMLLVQACGSKGLNGTTWKLTSVSMEGQEMPLGEEMAAEFKFGKDTVTAAMPGEDPEEMKYTLGKDTVTISTNDSDEVMEFKYDGKQMVYTDESGITMTLEKVK